MSRPFGFACALALSTVALAASAATLKPSDILANTSSFDGKTVTVAGKVDHFQTSKTMMGTVAGYQLCDTKCIIVVDRKNHTHANGDQVTVSGTFHVTFKAPHRTLNDAVVM